MIVAKIKRNDPTGRLIQAHINCNLIVDDESHVNLSGPKFGSIADGIVKSVSTSYSGSPYQLRLTVFVKSGFRGKYNLETWFVQF